MSDLFELYKLVKKYRQMELKIGAIRWVDYRAADGVEYEGMQRELDAQIEVIDKKVAQNSREIEDARGR